MNLCPLVPVIALFLLTDGPPAENPWPAKVPAAVERATAQPAVDHLTQAFDVCWKADDWQAAAKLADLALEKHPDNLTLRGRIVRVLWRAGWMLEAERLAARLPDDTKDPIALRSKATIHLARCEYDAARRIAERLERNPSPTAEDLYVIFAVRVAVSEMAGLADLARQIERVIDAEHGYPEKYIAESLAGLAEFLDAIGPQPVNRLAQPGSCPVEAAAMLGLPCCDVMINGQGPYRMILDTGGSILLSLDTEVAKEVGLESIATAVVRGVSGKDDSGQALVDKLEIGTIRCERVMTRIFGVRNAVMNAADGILGTGVFAEGRMTIDFVTPELRVTRSGANPAPGEEAELRLVGDAKLLTPITLEGQPATALLDTGADSTVLSPTRLRQLFPDQKLMEFDSGVGIGVGTGESASVKIGKGVDVKLGGRAFPDYSGIGLDVLDTLLGPIIGVQCDMIAGMSVFREMRAITIDFRTGKMWIDWLAR
jgi:predicted aspartyl protease